MLRLLAFVSVLPCLLAFLAAKETENRRWKDPAGTILAEGEFISLDEGMVCILTKAGRGEKIPLAALSEEDKAFVASNGGDLAQLANPTAHQTSSPATERPSIPEISRTNAATPPSETESSDAELESETISGRVPQPQTKPSVSTTKAEKMKRVVPFDFDSPFDGGDYGSRVGLGLWRKLNRLGKERRPGTRTRR